MIAIRNWLATKWRLLFSQEEVDKAYVITFSSLHGQVVLQNLLDGVYCQVCESNDPMALADHNGQRKVIHEILIKLDRMQNPHKYTLRERLET